MVRNASHITFRDSIIASEEDSRADRANIGFQSADTVVLTVQSLSTRRVSVRRW